VFDKKTGSGGGNSDSIRHEGLGFGGKAGHYRAMAQSNTTYYAQVYIAGCGDIGLRVARRWQQQAMPVTGIVRSEASVQQLLAQGVPALACDLGQPACCLPPLPRASLIYYFVPPPTSDQIDSHCRQFLRCLDQQAATPSRIVAISTTGVYGDRGGELVSEETPPNPQVDRARRRYDMECQLRAWCEQHKVDLIILRVGGIYGPGRLPLERIQKGIPILQEGLAPKTNRIHAEDLADICVAAAKVDQRYRVYNVSDGTDSNMSEYFLTLADYFGLPRPPQVDWAEAERVMSAGMLSYLRESRRVSNARMLEELNVKLTYPDLQSGLESCKEK
jgi:nucleoside-diphosphate-sugar epimerase